MTTDQQDRIDAMQEAVARYRRQGLFLQEADVLKELRLYSEFCRGGNRPPNAEPNSFGLWDCVRILPRPWNSSTSPSPAMNEEIHEPPALVTL